MSLSILPREIADLVAGHLDCDESPLGPLLFISPAFRAAAREYIFRHVILFLDARLEDAEPPRFGALLAVIQGDQDILKSIKKLSLQLYSGPATSVNTSHAKKLTQLLELLTAAPLRRLELLTHFGLFDFSILPSDVVMALIAIRSLPSLRTVVFDGLASFTPTLTTGLGQDDPITSLDIQGVRLINFPHPGMNERQASENQWCAPRPCPYANFLPKGHQFRALRYLKISWPGQFLASVSGTHSVASTHSQFPALKNLAIKDISDCHHEGLSDTDAVAMLVLRAPLLESLSIYSSFVSLVGASPHLYKSINDATNLRTLNLQCTKRRSDVAPYVRLLGRFLEGIASSSSIQTITVGFVWRIDVGFFGATREITIADRHDLEEIQDLLFKLRDALKKLVSLKRVTVTFDFTPSESNIIRDHAVAPMKELLDGISLGDGVAFEHVLITSGY